MSEEKKVSAEAGSTNDSANGDNAGKSNDSQKNEEKETVPKAQYDDLFTKLGENSEELGNLRKLFEETSPLMEKLNASPDLVKAIMDDKLSDENLIKAVLEDKVSIKEAEKIEKAHEKVKEEIGKKEYDKSTPEHISKLIEEKLSGVTNEFQKKISSIEEERELEKYEAKTRGFIESHKDFPELADEINKYMENNNLLDVSIAYDAVKGKKLQEKIDSETEEKAKEDAKDMAANMAGGGSMRGAVIKDKSLIDSLIAD